MANTVFFREVRDNTKKITWKEIFSESFKKHSKQERDRAWAAGTLLNSASEEDMLQKWQKPFLWFSAAKVCLLVAILEFAALYITLMIANDTLPILWLMIMITVPMLVPTILLIFIWELNIPKNISLMECLLWMLVGGVVSLGVTMLLTVIEPANLVGSTTWAPLTEEPAKLIAAVALMMYASKKQGKKIYGITGLVIGACVGAGFAAFESIQYGFIYLLNGGVTEMIRVVLIRAFFALGSHTLYCAPYSAAIAYNTKNGKITIQSFANKEFLVAFAFSFAMHALHNTFIFGGGIMDDIKSIVIMAVMWAVLLWITRICLNQVANVGRVRSAYYPPLSSAKRLSLICESGVLQGRVWHANAAAPMRIGRGSGNDVAFPSETPGISRSHCVVTYSNGGWGVTDAQSRYGTYINGHRLEAGRRYMLSPDDRVQLAGSAYTFRVRIED